MLRWLLIATLLAVPAFAAPPREPVAEATSLLAEGEFERALKVLDAALPRAKAPAEVARLQLARGQCLVALGETAKARAAFAAALKRDVTAELDPMRASPAAVDLFEKARAEVPATVAVTVTNGEANVRIDGDSMGPAPLTMQVSAGTHVFEAVAADGRTVKSELVVKPGRKSDVALALPQPVVAKPPEPVVTKPPEPVVAKPPEPVVTKPPEPVVTKPPEPVVAKPLEPVLTTPGEPPVEALAASASPLKPAGWIALAGGAVVAGAGVVCLLQAGSRFAKLDDSTKPPLTPAEVTDARRNGPLFLGLGWAGVGVGAAAVATGAALLALPSTPSSPSVTAAVAPDGTVWVGVSGRLP